MFLQSLIRNKIIDVQVREVSHVPDYFNDALVKPSDLSRGQTTLLMDRLPYRQKFLNDRNSKICYHSLKDHPKVSKIAKFRCEML